MNRRQLLVSLPALAAAAAAAPRLAAAPIPETARTKAGFSIAVQAWSLKEHTLLDAIEMTAAAGAQGIELYAGQTFSKETGAVKWGHDASDELVAKLLAHCDKFKVKPVNYGVINIDKDMAKARQVFELAKKLGLYGLTTESAGAIDIIEKLAEEYDLKVSFHNHPKPSALWNPDTVLALIKGRHPNLGFCADIGHWPSSGLDPLDVVKRIAPHIRSFHFKDRSSNKERGPDIPFGTGVLELGKILDAVRPHGFAGNVSIEYESNWKTNHTEIAQCAGYLRAYSRLVS